MEIPLDSAYSDYVVNIQGLLQWSILGNTVVNGHWVETEVLVRVCDEVGDQYRFGFNGQEKVNEISGMGNHNTAEFWEYDTRLGRRWNVDPVDQISVSNYAVFANNPIVFVDHNGDDARYTIKGNSITITSTIRVMNGTELERRAIFNKINEKWSKQNFKFNLPSGEEFNIKFNVQVLNGYGKIDLFTLKTDNFVYFSFESNYRAQTKGNIITFPMFNTNDASHEYGHTLGLVDLYFDDYIMKSFGPTNKDNYTLSAKNYIGVEKNDLMGKVGSKGQVLQSTIDALGTYILNDADTKQVDINGTVHGLIEAKKSKLGEIDPKTKLKSGEKPLPISLQ